MTANLRFRLLVLLLVPLMLLAAMGGWFSYSAADEASTQHDQRLLRFVIAPVKERLGEFDADEASNGAQTGIKDGIRMTKSAKQLLLLSWADTGRQRQIQPGAHIVVGW